MADQTSVSTSTDPVLVLTISDASGKVLSSTARVRLLTEMPAVIALKYSLLMFGKLIVPVLKEATKNLGMK